MTDAASARQIQAAEPTLSTWLSANAGSGKTRVLTDRVARLLLGGVEPQNIVCLTYTKAAAAEMQNRLFRRLGVWATLPMDGLREELAGLGETAAADPATLAEARRLFAKAIETPGGLRIQTIHSFCASLLRRFPLEAGVSPSFIEMDDQSAAHLRAQVLDDLAVEEPERFDQLAMYLSGDDLAPLLQDLLREKERFRTPFDSDAIKTACGAPISRTPDDIVDTVFTGIEPNLAQNLLSASQSLTKSYKSFATDLAALNLTRPSQASFEALCDSFLYKSGQKAGQSKSANFPQTNHRAAREAWALLLPDLHDFMDRVADASAQLRALEAAAKSEALHLFAQSYLPRYEMAKQRQGWLDFDDLILKTRDLLSRPAVAEWVLFKLDGRLDHILVDEAQDTSPTQWEVIQCLSQELTAGLGAREEVPRSLFVVGDKKQSIYSFQGADARQFDIMRDHFSAQLRGSATPLRPLELEHSFRSSPAVLRFVDTAVKIDPISHMAYWSNLPGRVDIWPAIPPVETQEDVAWYDPVDLVAENHHNATLATSIANFITGTLESETVPTISGERRAVRAADFLILVQRRSDLFERIIRACKSAGLPVAGADRLKLGAELAVKDLAALLSVLATPEDDLALATVLKSPLFGWDEKTLYQLAQGRGSAYLFQELRQRRDEFPQTFAMLTDLRDQADFLRPYDLIERILIRHSGRQKLLARLGAEAEDGMDTLLLQALAYERTDVPSLTGFLNWFQSGDIEVKRQLGTENDQIRVMTVHGAKGLEAPIVILPDTAKRNTPDRSQVVPVRGGVPLWNMPQDARPEPLAEAMDARAEAQKEEQERLFYVAATRAEYWLVIAGAGKVGDADDSWHGKSWSSLAALPSVPLHAPTGEGLRYAFGDWDKGALVTNPALGQSGVPMPANLAAPVATPPPAKATRSPTDLGGAKALPGGSGRDEADAKLFGSAVHHLLEIGPDILRNDSAETFLARNHPDVPAPEALAAARRVIEAPLLAFLFDQTALSEVALSADVPSLGPMHGTIDRLIVSDTRVLAVDFKSNVIVPKQAADVPDGLLRQMGAYHAMLSQIYPTRLVEVALLWTSTAELMPLPCDIVRSALQDATTS